MGRDGSRAVFRNQLLAVQAAAERPRVATGDLDHRLAEIGAHTVQHPSLASLSESEQRREINASRTELRAISGQLVNSFAYPYGRRADYSEQTVLAVHDAGFDAACINEQGYVKSDTDALQLPRFWVANWDGPTFEGYLSRWLAEAYAD